MCKNASTQNLHFYQTQKMTLCKLPILQIPVQRQCKKFHLTFYDTGILTNNAKCYCQKLYAKNCRRTIFRSVFTEYRFCKMSIAFITTDLKRVSADYVIM